MHRLVTVGCGFARLFAAKPCAPAFTIPHPPVRRRIHGIETFNVLRGGEYFFMPSLSALRWIGSLA